MALGASAGVSASNTRTKNQALEEQVYKDPRAQVGLDALTAQAGGGDPNATSLSNFYRTQMAGGKNPYLESSIASENQLGQRGLQDNLALIRLGGFRGGAGRGAIDQGMFMSDFAAKQAANNSRLRLDDYNTGQGRAMSGASGLQGLSGQQAGSSVALLDALRGKKQQGSSESTTIAGNAGFSI